MNAGVLGDFDAMVISPGNRHFAAWRYLCLLRLASRTLLNPSRWRGFSSLDSARVAMAQNAALDLRRVELEAHARGAFDEGLVILARVAYSSWHAPRPPR